MSNTEFQAFFLVGTTAVGKSAVAQWIAERDGSGILSADSMLIYEGMDIGTAKPSSAERDSVPYFGIDLASPAESFNVWQYRQYVVEHESELLAAGDKLVVAGGTGLYVKALIQGLDARTGSKPETRKEWEGVLKEHGVPGLQSALKERSIERFEALADKENPRRLIRALESTHKGAGPAVQSWRDPYEAGTIVGLRISPETLNARIEARCHSMYEDGLLNEVEQIREAYPSLSDTARQAIGYAEAMQVLAGELEKDEAIERTIVRTRQLAKRQRTWFRNQLKVDWVECDSQDSIEDIANGVKRKWQQHGPTNITK